MKRFTFILLAALLVSVCGWAQLPTREVVLPQRHAAKMVKQDVKKMPSKSSLQRQHDLSRQKSARQSLTAKPKIVNEQAGKTQKRVQLADITGDEELITEQPAGRQVSYARSGEAYYYFWGYIFNTAYSGLATNVVFGDNNEVYIKNIITQYNCNSWVKGTVNGSQITIDFPQLCLSQQGYNYYVTLMEYDASSQSLIASEKESTLTLDYDPATGAISTPKGSAFESGELYVGMVADDLSWVGYADWNVNMTVFDDVPVSAPEGLETELYSVSAQGYGGGLAQVGFDGNDVYVQGLYSGLPEGWVKGTIEGGKVIFKSGQYIGADLSAGYFQYLVSATGQEVWDDYYGEWYTEYSLTGEDIVFDYDASTKTLSNGSTFLVNAGTKEVNYAAAYTSCKIAPFTETAATPAAPEWIKIDEGGLPYYNSGYGWGALAFNINTNDVDGNYILPEKLSYAIYTRTNGEEKPLVLSWNDYMYQEVPEMAEIPYGYSDGWDIYVSGTERDVYYYVIGPEAFGVQTIYRGAGEEHRSEIVWYDVTTLGSEIQPDAATPEYADIDPEDVGSSIGYGFYTGNEEVSMFGEAKPQTYNVAIKLQDPSLTGTHIETISIPLMDLEGVSGVSAWLSSQLRVEDNKNAADLVTIPVTPTEAGFVEVKLEKPYIIPAEGVYVGYTLTIDEVSNDESSYPVAVISKANEGGFYLQTSAGFLKWMDASELFGLSSAIQVVVSGRNVKENSAGIKTSDTEYVTVGSAITKEIELVNHGSKGIASFDVEYTLNGQTGIQHIDLEEPVDPIFGKTTAAKLDLPAISSNGTYELTLNVKKVNGVDNEDASAQTSSDIIVLNTVPTHKTLIEEYTGTWCGWCPRGLVALEQLAELYPNDFVRVSYHNGDPMEIMPSEQFPSYVPGFPDAWLDRMMEVDPYYGTTEETDLYVIEDMKARSKVFGHGSIDFTASWGADGNTVDVNAEVSFPYAVNGNKFAIEYVLVADGLTGEGSSWEQSNYYSGGGYGDMGGFGSLGETVPGVVFNDVAIMSSQIGGINGSLPANIEADKVNTHQYTFYLEDALNTSGEPIITDKTKVKLRVVGLIVDRNTGEVVNANAAVVGESTAIRDANGMLNQVASVSYYDLGGRRLNAAQRGVNIIKISYTDGTEKTVKVFK